MKIRFKIMSINIKNTENKTLNMQKKINKYLLNYCFDLYPEFYVKFSEITQFILY